MTERVRVGRAVVISDDDSRQIHRNRWTFAFDNYSVDLNPVK